MIPMFRPLVYYVEPNPSSQLDHLAEGDLGEFWLM